MAIKQYKRRSGVTTVKKDGKIVGNIGVGKARIPQPQTLATKVVEETVTKTAFNSENIQTLWEITATQPIAQRLNMISAMMDSLPYKDKKKFAHQLLDAAKEDKDFHREIIAMLQSDYHNVNESTLDWITDIPYPQWRVIVASNKNTPPSILQKLAKYKAEDIRRAIINNLNISPELLHSIALVETRGYVAGELVFRKRLLPETLTLLANKFEDRIILSRIALHKNTTVETLNYLADNLDKNVRHAVTMNPKATAEALTKVAKRLERITPNTRYHIYFHKNTPKDVADSLYAGTTPPATPPVKTN